MVGCRIAPPERCVLQTSSKLEAAMSAYNEVVELYGARVNLWSLQRQVTASLIHKMVLQTDAGNAVAALRTYEELEPRLDLIDLARKNELKWQAMRAWMQALLVQRDLPRLIDSFKLLYDVFVPCNDSMIREMLDLVPDLLAAGLVAQDLVEILSHDGTKATSLTPLLVALNQFSGDTVRAPDEILEIAADIGERLRHAVDSSPSQQHSV